MENYPYPVKEA